jgi:predicted DCC family thiol-disulfide oxidoreductase YuxK
MIAMDMSGLQLSVAPAAKAGKVQVFFDGACPICSREIAWGRRRDRSSRIEWIDIAGADFRAEAYGLDGRRIHEVMHVRDALGRVHTGVDAFVQIAQALPRSFLTVMFLSLLKVPGAMWVARGYYKWFARNRYRLGGRCTAESCRV